MPEGASEGAPQGHPPGSPDRARLQLGRLDNGSFAFVHCAAELLVASAAQDSGVFECVGSALCMRHDVVDFGTVWSA